MIPQATPTESQYPDGAGPIPVLARRDDAVRVWLWRHLRLTDESSFALSERCGFGRGACHRWLTGASEPSFARGLVLLDACGVELDRDLPVLISGADAMRAVRAGGDA